MGCKNLWGVGSRKSHIPTPVSHRGPVQRFFYVFIFCLRGDNWEYRVGWGLQVLCPPLTSTNAVSVFFLSLSRARTPAPDSACWPIPCWGASRKKTGCPARTRLQRGTSQPHPLPCLPLHRLLLPSHWGLSVWGEGSHLKTMPHLQLLTPEMPASTTDTTRPAPHRTEDSKAFAGPSRPGCLVFYSSCIKLSPCPFLPLPQCFF